MIQRPTDVRLANYAELVQLWSNQQKQDNTNKQVHDAFVLAASDWKNRNMRNRDMNLPIEPAPELPLMTIWNDDGSVSHPSFPDLRVPVLDPPVAGIPLPGGFHTTPAPPDRLDTVLTLLNALFEEVEAIKTKVGA